jgi:hypothetical protein
MDLGPVVDTTFDELWKIDVQGTLWNINNRRVIFFIGTHYNWNNYKIL